MTTGLQNQQGQPYAPQYGYGQGQIGVAAPGQFASPGYAVPTPGSPVQSVDLEGFRWKSLHGQAKSSVLKLANLIGTNFPATEDELNNGVLSNDDLMLNDDGSPDMDFEESSIETLGESIVEARKLVAILERFHHNLVIRPKGSPQDEQPQS